MPCPIRKLALAAAAGLLAYLPASQAAAFNYSQQAPPALQAAAQHAGGQLTTSRRFHRRGFRGRRFGHHRGHRFNNPRFGHFGKRHFKQRRFGDFEKRHFNRLQKRHFNYRSFGRFDNRRFHRRPQIIYYRDRFGRLRYFYRR